MIFCINDLLAILIVIDSHMSFLVNIRYVHYIAMSTYY